MRATQARFQSREASSWRRVVLPGVEVRELPEEGLDVVRRHRAAEPQREVVEAAAVLGGAEQRAVERAVEVLEQRRGLGLLDAVPVRGERLGGRERRARAVRIDRCAARRARGEADPQPRRAASGSAAT